MSFELHDGYGAYLIKKRFLLSGIIVFGLVASLIVFMSDEAPAEIYRESNTVFYHGGINGPSYEILKSMIDNDPSIDTLEIRSDGGDTAAGRDIGKLVFDRKLNVVVDTICFSSCANYIFPSGSNKFIKEDGFVGWHGSEFQFDILAEMDGVSTESYIKDAISDAFTSSGFFWHTDADVQNEYDRMVESVKLEQIFFDTIEIDKNVTLNGIPKIFEEDSGCYGWTHSIFDMTTYGIDNVSYLSEKIYPDESVLSKYNICVV